MGMSIKQFYNLSFREWHNISKGYYRKLERETRHQWEMARMQMYATLLPHAKKGSQLTPQGVMPFTWDNEDVEPIDKEVPKLEDIMAQKKRWEDRDKLLKKREVEQ